MAAEDKCIGRLYLDIKQVKQDIDEVNKFLGKIGANVNLEKKLSEGIKNALNKMVNEAKQAGEEASKAVSNIGKGSGTQLESLQSRMQKVTSEVATFVREADQSGKTVEKLVSTVTSGFDKAGDRIKEFANAEGDIVKRTEEIGTGVDAAIKMYVRLYDQMAKLRTMQNSGNTSSANYIKTANEVAQLSAQIDALDDKMKESARDSEEASRAISQYNQIIRGSDQSHALRELINLYKELYSMSERAIKAGTRGDNESVERYQQVATAIRAQITELERGNEELGVRARRSEEVRNAELRWSETAETAQRRREANSAREIENIDRIIAREEERVRTEAQLAEREQERTRIEQERTRRADYEELWINLLKEQDQALTDLINKYKEYYGLESKKIQAVNNGDINSADMYRARAQAIWEEISAIEAERPRLADLAGATEQVTKAVRDWQAVANAGQIKSDNIINKQEIENTEQALNNLIQKYQEYYALESQKINAVHRGDIESADIYRERAKALWEEIRAIEAANPKLAELASESDKVNKAVQQWQMTAKQGEINAEKMFGIQGIANAKQKYFELTDAIKNYQAASKLGNKDDMSMWQEKITAIMQEVNAIEQAVQASDLEAGVKQQILNIIQQCTTAEHQHNAAINESVRGTGELESQMTGLLTRMFSLMAVIRTIKSLIQNTVEYVSEYSDKMNEIQMITLKTDAEVAELADTYRNLAEMMNVSSLDMADAAIYFTRQGLGAAEIENRLKNVTMYAKAANVEFKDASEIITAVVNSMGLVEQEAEDGRNAAQRVADVFLKVGDSAATSGQEIGEAMQKAAASAGAFGMSFEWLASYIATVSETTRQEARTIGTALNTIIARLHQIKQQGYNSEDETKINDVQKALANIGVTLMNQNNEWRDMDTIFQEIGEKWDKLDGKTKSYIATTMAGVKQQNVFLALMNDLGKHVEDSAEEGSRAWELYTKAIDSAGTAADKYAVYMDSVTASQERLTVAQEKFYSLLDSSVIKNWNDMLAGFVNNVSKGAEVTGGLNLILPVAVGLFTAFAIAIQHAGTASAFFANIWESHPILVAIGAAAAVMMTLVTAISSVAGAVQTAEEKINSANQAISDSQARIADYKKLQGQLGDVFAAVEKSSGQTDESLTKYKDTLDKIANVSPEAKKAVEDLTQGLVDQQTAAENVNKILEDTIKMERQIAALALVQKYNNITPEKISNAAKDTDWARHYFDSASGIDYTDWTFTEILQRKYLDKQVGSFVDLPQEVYNYIQKNIDELNLEDTEENWGLIGKLVWEDFGLGNLDHTKEQMESAVKSAIDDVVASMSAYLSDAEQGVLTKRLLDAVYGEDGELDESEYQDYAQNIEKVIAKILATDFEFTDDEIAQSIEAIKDELFDAIETMGNVDGLDGGMWLGLDIETLTTIRDLMANYGVELARITNLMKSSSSVEEFKEKLEALSKELNQDIEQGGEEAAESLTTTVKKITQEIDKLNKMIDKIKKGEPVDFEDLLNLADAHPEIMAVIHDTESLLKALQNLKSEDMSQAINKMRETLMTNADFAKGTEFGVGEGQSLQDFVKEHEDTAYAVTQYVNQVIASFLAQSDQLQYVGKDILGQWMNSLFSDSNVDLLNRKAVKVGDDIATVLTESVTASMDGKHGIQWNQDIIMHFTPITPEGEKLDDDTFYKYIEELLSKSANVEELFANDKVDAGGLGLLMGVDTVENWEEAIKNAETLDELLHLLQAAYYGVTEANKSWLQIQMEQQELNEQNEWAKSNGYIDQIGMLSEGLTEGIDSAQTVYETWNTLDETLRKSMMDTYPGLTKTMFELENAIGDVENATGDGEAESKRLDAAMKNLEKTLKKASTAATTKNFEKTYDAIAKLEKGTISATEAYDTFSSEIDKLTKAEEDINDVTQKLSDGTDLTAQDVTNLASVIGKTTDEVLNDFPAAKELFYDLIGEAGELRSAFDALNEEAFIQITGVSEADFSEIQNGLIAIQDVAQETIDKLVATGQWTVETIPLTGEQWVLEGTKMIKKQFNGAYQQVLKPTNNNPYKGTSSTGSRGSTSGGRGSGSGSRSGQNSDVNKMTEVELMLNRMEQGQNISDYQRGYYQSQSSYYSQTGYLQGVIGANEKEIEVLEQQNKTLEKNVAKIEKSIEAKKAELATLDKSDEKYEEVRDDLDKLQKAHQEYSKKLIDNKTNIDQLNESIDEQRKKIRDMVINIKNEIYQAIEDREAKKKNMFEGEIEMENTILDLIKKRYEKERDLILANTDRKITALQEERDLLSEQLELRKKMADQEDKAAKLAQLEANYQRIIADPTRKKEAQKLKDQINDLRKEMAWDAAEDEVKSQQEAIDQQITSLEDYKQYIEEFYEDLFEHPQKLIDEMKSIMEMTDEEIIEWLSENDENFAAATENTQTKMIEGWQQTLDDMHGKIKTYWAEVEEIYKQGDEAIIEFLKENSSEYQKAGKEQAEKYVEEWKKALTDLRKATAEPIVITIAQEYEVMDPGTSNSGGSSSGSKNGGTTQTQKENHGYSFVYGGKTYAKKGFKTKDEAQKAMEERVTKEVRALTPATGASYMGEAIRAIQKGATVYAKGGLAYNTGLAWLDGTQQNPERVLSPYQTKLFETMVQALEKMSTISIPSMPNFGNMPTGNANNVSVGDIIVNVDNLDTDADYDELAEKVSDVLMERIGRTAVVGGLRINA